MEANELTVYFFVWSLLFECLFAQDQEQSTPLHAAAYLGDVNTIDLLIASGRKIIYLDWNM